jgi:hypothetical protein
MVVGSLVLYQLRTRPKPVLHVDLNAFETVPSEAVRAHPVFRLRVDATAPRHIAEFQRLERDAGPLATAVLDAAQVPAGFRTVVPSSLLWLFDVGNTVVDEREQLSSVPVSATGGPRQYAEWNSWLHGLHTKLHAHQNRLACFTGKCPSTTWTTLGRLLGEPHMILFGEYRNPVSTWILYDDQRPSVAVPPRVENVTPRLLALNQVRQKSGVVGGPTAVHVFLTLDPNQLIADSDVDFVEADLAQVMGRPLGELRVVCVAPSRDDVSGARTEMTPDNVARLRGDIHALVREALPVYVDVVSVSTAAPAPLAFELGQAITRARAARVVTYERCGASRAYERAFSV